VETILAFVIGGLYATGFYLMLRRSIVKLVLGLGLLGHAANLLIFTVANPARGLPPLIPEGVPSADRPFADPLPQALILTAIVIGFAVQAFALVLVHRAVQTAKTDDLDRLNTTDT
jgi:multicomponent Na+:H+ antiporter subunit C